MQDALPHGSMMMQLVEYHERYLLWQHNSMNGRLFRHELITNLQAGGGKIQVHRSDILWVALLFSILAASLSSAPHAIAERWGCNTLAKQKLANEWHKATITCLELGGDSSKSSLYFVQAVQVLALSSHLLGHSERQFALFGESVQLAQNLGFHMLPTRARCDMLTEDQVMTDTGRRIWWALAVQDWFAVPPSCLPGVDPLSMTTCRPRPSSTFVSAEDEALLEYINRLADIATILLDFRQASMLCGDAATKYEQVLKHDARFRQLAVTPVFERLDSSIPWVPWASRVLRIVATHKVLKLHRQFLTRSFEDDAYVVSRWASIEASKAILKEMQEYAADANAPIIWTTHANLVDAGIVLCTDAMHRSENDPLYYEHHELVQQISVLLSRFPASVIATQGHELLSGMLRGENNATVENLVGYTTATVSAQETASIDPVLRNNATKSSPPDDPTSYYISSSNLGLDPVLGGVEGSLMESPWNSLLSELCPDQRLVDPTATMDLFPSDSLLV